MTRPTAIARTFESTESAWRRLDQETPTERGIQPDMPSMTQRRNRPHSVANRIAHDSGTALHDTCARCGIYLVIVVVSGCVFPRPKLPHDGGARL